MTPPRSSVRCSLCALAFLVLAGCGKIEDALGGPNPEPPVGGPPPPGFATDILAAQNAVRADPGAVGGSPAPTPALSPLGWSDAVAARAQAYADGCTWGHDVTALHGLGYGENLAAATPGYLTPAQAVAGWAAEAPFYHYDTNTCDASNPANTAHTCGHYTQLVWRSSTVVGCGFRTCATGSPFGSGSWDYWVCDYAPAGNFVGERPY